MTENENLLQKYKKTKDYYRWHQTSDALFVNFNQENAFNFIKKYFSIAGKETVLDADFLQNYSDYNKYEHTVSLFFLGLNLKELVEEYFNLKLNDLGLIEKIENDTFSYIWFLICLYHDIASAIEKQDVSTYSRGNNLDLDYFLGQYNIKYNVFNHNWKNNQKPYNYSEYLIKNYFKYRLEEMNKIDHGIIAGFLLYDKLIKNYNEKCKNSLSNNYNEFEYANLKWKIHHQDYYALAAHSIIEHNIWLAEKNKIQSYKKYGLDELMPVKNKKKRISIKNSPLLFYLGLLDSIEPLKILINNCDNNSKDVLESISFNMAGNNKEVTFFMKSEYLKSYSKKIKTIRDWLDCCIVPSTDKFTIKILEGS